MHTFLFCIFALLNSKKLKRKEIQKVRDILQSVHKIAVVFHFNPDGDAVGCALALYHYFKDDGYEVSVVSPNAFPDFLGWMDGSEQIIVAQEEPEKAQEAIRNAELLFVVDMNAPHRAGDLADSIKKFKGAKILIDHHLQPDIVCDVMYSTSKTSSACELVYNFLYRYLTPQRPFTKAIAEALYVGIITDTGSVSYACDCPNTYHVLKKLITSGIDGESIHRKVYDNYSESRIRLLGLALSQRLTVLPEYGVSYIYLTKKDLLDNNFQIGDTEGFVNYGLSIKSVEFTAFFTERDNRIRVSFRSKGDFDVNVFARTFFNGGGHRNAAGAFYYGTIQEAVAHFERAVKTERAAHTEMLYNND